MIQKLNNAVFSNDYMAFGDVDSNIVTFFSNDICININIDDDNLDDCDPKTVNHIRLWLGKIDLNKGCKKRKMKN